MLRVALITPYENGCGFHRMIYPGRSVEAAGYAEVNFLRTLPRLLADPRLDVDVVVFQRPTMWWIPKAIERLQRLGRAVVVEVDDDMSAIPASHPAFSGMHPRVNREENWEHVRRAAAAADIVTVSTPPLRSVYGRHGRVRVIRNCVPASLLSKVRNSDGCTVGWAGATILHPGDLAVTNGGVAQAIRDRAHFHIIGPADGVRDQLRLDDEPSATGEVSIDGYDEALGALDVGIVPLARSRFTEAKSTLKGLQYAARGVAFVASPLPEYERLSSEGVGILAADRARNWRAGIVSLLEDPARRNKFADYARDVVAARYTYDRNAYRWAEAWEHAAAQRKAARRQAIAGRRAVPA